MKNFKFFDIGEICINFEKFGKCIFGVICRYGKNYILKSFKNIVNEELYEKIVFLRIKIVLSKELVFVLRKKKYEFVNLDIFVK